MYINAQVGNTKAQYLHRDKRPIRRRRSQSPQNMVSCHWSKGSVGQLIHVTTEKPNVVRPNL